jgi:transcriptional regulator with GAF, ATPase, and Fis domain
MDLEKRVARLERLLGLNKRIVAEEDVNRCLDLALEAALDFTDAHRGFVLTRESDGVRVRAARNLDRQTVRSDHFRPSRQIADRVLIQGEAILSEYVPGDDRFSASESISAAAVKSVLAIPIRSRDAVLGAIYLDKRGFSGPGISGFDEEDLRILQDVGDIAAVAVEVRRLVLRLEEQDAELRDANRRLEAMAANLKEDVALKSVELGRLETEVEAANRALGQKYTFHNIVSRSGEMHRIFDVLSQVMDYPVPILITGDSGTGKELIARATHHGGPRSSEPFMAINCAAIPETLLESELFGYKKGSFTGATGDKEGLFRSARRGTVFLDEIGEMPMALQGKILRVLQEREVLPIGGRDAEPVEARIVAATNRDLRHEITQGTFREDLFYRLNVVEVRLPPLRERVEDIPALADHFLERFADEMGMPRKRFSERALQALCRFEWPGNVRQLENAVKGSAILSRGEVIGHEELRLPEADTVVQRPSAGPGEGAPASWSPSGGPDARGLAPKPVQKTQSLRHRRLRELK